MRYRLTIAGASCALGVMPTAHGAFLTPQYMTADDFAFGDYAATGLVTHRIWLDGLAPGDTLLAIFGDETSPLTVSTVHGGTLYNALELGQGHFAANPALFPAFPDLQWDTYLAIGEDPGVGGWTTSPGFPDLALFGGGASIVDHDNLAWFDGDPTTGVVEDGGRILIAQVSAMEGDDFFGSMTVSAQIRGADGTVRFERDLVLIPAPAGLALLGLGGLRGRRRR